MLTAQELREIGEALYGSGWRAAMASRLGKTKRTIERYATGDRSVPASMKGELLELVADQVATLESLGDRLEG